MHMCFSFVDSLGMNVVGRKMPRGECDRAIAVDFALHESIYALSVQIHRLQKIGGEAGSTVQKTVIKERDLTNHRVSLAPKYVSHLLIGCIRISCKVATNRPR